MFQQKWRNEAVIDVVNFALAAFLFVSPWIFGFTSEIARHTSWMAGVAIGTVAIFAIFAFVEGEEWINLIFGLWLAACPWILGFPEMIASRVHLMVGLVVAALAAAEIWLVHRTPPHVRA
jgi:hypothetical protein